MRETGAEQIHLWDVMSKYAVGTYPHTYDHVDLLEMVDEEKVRSRIELLEKRGPSMKNKRLNDDIILMAGYWEPDTFIIRGGRSDRTSKRTTTPTPKRWRPTPAWASPWRYGPSTRGIGIKTEQETMDRTAGFFPSSGKIRHPQGHLCQPRLGVCGHLLPGKSRNVGIIWPTTSTGAPHFTASSTAFTTATASAPPIWTLGGTSLRRR